MFLCDSFPCDVHSSSFFNVSPHPTDIRQIILRMYLENYRPFFLLTPLFTTYIVLT